MRNYASHDYKSIAATLIFVEIDTSLGSTIDTMLDAQSRRCTCWSLDYVPVVYTKISKLVNNVRGLLNYNRRPFSYVLDGKWCSKA